MASIDLIRASNGSGDAVKATVANARVISSTTLQVDATTNWPSKFIATVGDVDGTGAFVPATVTVFNGILSGGNIEITSFAPGYTDIGNTPGQIVVLKPTTAWANEVASTLGVAHNDNGTLKSPVGINKVPENGALDVAGDIYSNGVKLTGFVDGIVEYNVTSTSSYYKYASGRCVQTVRRSYTGPVSTSWNGMRISSIIATANYPVTLTQITAIHNTVVVGSGTSYNIWHMSGGTPSLSSTGSIYVISAENITASSTYHIYTTVEGVYT